MGNLTASIARLYRAGDEHSKQWEKLQGAISDLLVWLGKHVPQNIPLPASCRIVEEHLPYEKIVYVLHCGTKDAAGHYSLSSEANNDRRSTLRFCELIAQHNWLDKVSETLESWTSQYREASGAIDTMLRNH